jgi:serine/threonine protein kinase
MLNFPQIKKVSDHLYIEETDAPLPETLNPKTRYAFFSTLATGGKSLIQSCRDLHLRRTVCYKSLRSKYQKDPIENKRLLREARIAAMLQHPNTIPAHEIGRDNRGNIYFTMKLVHGYTLREVLNYRERYDLTQLMDVIIQIGNALAYAHSVGVLHRDIKPENILIGPYGEVLLLDWGLAKVWHKNPLSIEDEIEEAEETGNHNERGMTGQAKLQGSVMYMSPEQIDRDPEIGFQADIYSLGAVLYEVLTGSTPFQGNIVRVIMDQIRADIPSDAKSVGGGAVPNVLADLAMRCLQKEPQNRPTSANEIVRILKDDWAARDLT